MTDFVRREICEGVGFSSVTDDRFKYGRLSVTLIVPLKKQSAAANALLGSVLTRSCKQYPDYRELNCKLDSLYGAGLFSSRRQIGDYQAITITARGLDDRYAFDGCSVSSELAELLCSILFEPNINNGLFAEEDVAQEKRQLLEDIDAEYSDKRSYALLRCVEAMFAGETFAIGPYGSREDAEALTNEQTAAAWEELLKNARVEITMLGNTDPENALRRFEGYFGNQPRRPVVLEPQIVVPEQVRRVAESDEVAQSKLVMGFRSAYPQDDAQALANSLMSAVLGATPTSKLFLNVREKKSLCYYCVSRVNNDKGYMFIDSGVETENIAKTEEAVLEQVENMKRGVISDSEVENARLALKNSLMSSVDNLISLQGFYISRLLRKSPLSPMEAYQRVDSITKEQLIELAQQLELDTVFSLVGN